MSMIGLFLIWNRWETMLECTERSLREEAVVGIYCRVRLDLVRHLEDEMIVRLSTAFKR